MSEEKKRRPVTIHWTHVEGVPVWEMDLYHPNRAQALRDIHDQNYMQFPRRTPILLIKIRPNMAEIMLLSPQLDGDRDAGVAWMQFDLPKHADDFLDSLEELAYGEFTELSLAHATSQEERSSDKSYTALGVVIPGEDEAKSESSDDEDLDWFVHPHGYWVYTGEGNPSTAPDGTPYEPSGLYIPWGDPDFEEYERKRGFPRGPIVLWLKEGAIDIAEDDPKAVGNWIIQALKV